MEMTRAVDEAEHRLQGIVSKTPLQSSSRLSERYEANILIKREDMQAVQSFKIRGAYNKIASLPPEDRKRPIVCASAGNHAQGVAFACAHLGIGGTIVMPRITPTQKIERVAHFGGEFVEIRLAGESYDEASQTAEEYCQQTHGIFVHPFDDIQTIAGQGTVGKEIYEATGGEVGAVILPIGGGGLASGVASYIKERNSSVAVIGAEPAGSPSMYESLKQGRGQLRQFVDDALGPTDDIVRFEYIKKTNKERGAALVGIELKDKADLEPLLRRMEQIPLNFRPLGSEDLLYDYIV